MPRCALFRSLTSERPVLSWKKRAASFRDQFHREARTPECLEQRIAPASVSAGNPGSFFDTDGDAFTVKLTGPGTVEVLLDDPDGDGSGSIASLVLAGTTAKSKLSVAVKGGGDREVSIGAITGAGDLRSFSAPKSDLVGSGLDVDGTFGSLKLSDVRNGAEITLDGTATNRIALAFGEIGDGSDLTFGATVTKLTALRVGTGEWSAPSFGLIATKGGGFGASVLATATAEQLGKTPALRVLNVVGGDLSGDVNALGNVGTISVKQSKSGGGNIAGATLAAANFKTISAGRDITSSMLLAGADLGADFTVSAGDNYGPGTIGKFNAGGAVNGSVVGAGLFPGDLIVGNEDDGLLGGTQSVVKKFTIKGSASADSLFASGVFPKKTKIGGSTVTPVSDPRFLTIGSPDMAAPVLNAALTEDTGASASDHITLNPNVSGRVTDNLGAPMLSAAFGTGALVDVSSAIGSDGRFTLDAARLTTINGGSLPDGAYTLRLQAGDAAGNLAPEVAINFELDRTAPEAPVFNLSPGSDTGVVGDQLTNAAVVQLTGQAAPNISVLLGNRTALASATGSFVFPDVALATGDNLLTARVLDVAGNAGQSVLTITRSGTPGADVVLEWNSTNLEAIRFDATAPPTATRGLAMVSGAMFDVVNAFEGTAGFFTTQSAPTGASLEAAVGAAAHDVLVYLFPGQTALFDATLTTTLGRVPDGAGETSGVGFGAQIAASVIALRAQDGFNAYVDYAPGSVVGDWQSTGPMFDIALSPQWAQLEPFLMTSGDQFRPTPPPALESAEYAAAFNEVKALGVATGSTRTAEQTQIARFWSDGAGTYTPPGHWNTIAMELAQANGLSLSANARMLAQLNLAMADAAIVSWDAKYFYETWRPITAIHDAALDGNAQTTADPVWQPLLITPPFPEYTSGHSTFSGAASTVLGAVFGEQTSFSTTGLGLPGVTRSFTSFDAAADEAGRSRIFGGIHFQFANEAGLASGRALGDFVLDRFAVEGDFAAPKILFEGPASGLVTKDNFTISGRVLDNISGVASFKAQLDGGTPFDVTRDANGAFSLPVTLALDGTADGAHTFIFSALDAAGNATAPENFNFTLDTLAPTLAFTPALDGAELVFGSRLAGTAAGTGSAIRSLSYTFDGGTAFTVGLDPATGAFDSALDLSALPPGAHALAVMATDSAGLTTTSTFNVNLAQRIPFTVLGATPGDEALDVGTTYRPQLFFSRPVNPTTLNANNFFATGPDGAKLPATIVPGAEGEFAWLFFNDPMPGGANITLHVDGTTILAAADATPLDADRDATPGGHFDSSFTTVSLTPLLGTSLSGRVFDPGPDLKPMTFDDIRAGADGVLHSADDVFLNPLAGVKVFIIGRESDVVFTDANGAFSFASVPAGNVKLAIDGNTATNEPASFYFPEMVMDLNLRAGQANTVMGSMGTLELQADNADRGEVYLPRLRTDILESVSNSAVTMVGVDPESAPNLTEAQRQRLILEVQPGSLVDANGQPITNGQVGISAVPPALVRDMLPPGVLQHTFDITIQAPGAAVFNTPLEITFPNVFNAAPGTKLDFLSFDHTTGRLVIEGTATVSADGLSATTDAGTGITKPGWHGLTPPGLCVGSGGAPLMPPPKPEPGDTVTEHDAISLGMIYGNITPTFEWQWQAPNPVEGAPPPTIQPGCNVPQRPPAGTVMQPFLNVTIELDGPLATFMKKPGDLTGGLELVSQSFTLPAGQGGNVIFAGVPRDLDEFLRRLPDRDQLYGSKIKITEIHQDADGFRTYDIYTYYIYRWVNVVGSVDSFFSEKRAAFHKTLATEFSERTKTVDVHLPKTVATSFEGGSPRFFQYGASVSGERTTVWKYTPEPGQSFADTDTLKVNAADTLIGDLTARATSIKPTVIGLNEAGFKAELERVIRALEVAPGFDGIPGTVDDVIHYAYADGKTVLASERFKMNFAGFLPANRLPGPDGLPGNSDDTFSGGNLALRLDAEFEQMEAAVRSDFDAVQSDLSILGRAFTFSDASPDVTVNWHDLSPDLAGRTGESKVDANGAELEHAFSIFSHEREAGKQWLLAEELNLGRADSVEVNVSVGIEARADIPLGVKMANAVSHQLAHTFGLNSAYHRLKFPNVEFLDNVVPLPDLMNASTPDDGDLSFSPETAALLQAAMGFHPNKDLPLTDALSTYLHHLTLSQKFIGAQEIIKPLPAAELAVYDGGKLISPGREIQIGSDVPADGTGGQLAERQIVLTNPGNAAMRILAVTLSGGGASPITLVNDVVGREIDPGDQVTLTVRFDPRSAGDFTDTLTVTSNARTLPVFTTPLFGSALPFEPTAAVTVENNNLGGVPAASGTAQLPQVATVRNDGAQPLLISDIRFTEGLGPFSLLGVPADLATNPISLDTRESFTFGLAFDPLQLGLQRAIIEVETNDPAAPLLNVAAVGTGLGSVVYPDWGEDFVAIRTNTTLRTVSDAAGHFEVFLPPQTDYEVVIFDPVTGLVAHKFGGTPESGRGVDLTSGLVFAPSTALDTDFDGLADDIELAIGTSDINPDSDGDDVDDFTEIAQGTNPLDGFDQSVGITGGLDFGGVVSDLELSGGAGDEDDLTGYAATDEGLSIFTVDEPGAITLLSELDIAGGADDVGYDGDGDMLALAADEVLHIVDVSDRRTPVLVRTVDVDATDVEVFDGVAYAASGGTLQAIDLSTGEIIQTLNLGPANITGLAREGSLLFVAGGDSSTAFEAIAVGCGVMTERDTLTLPTIGSDVFAGGGVAYIGAEGAAGAGGFMTVDVSDPDDLKLLSGVDSISIAGGVVAADGAGGLVTIGAPPAGNGAPVLDVVNIADPTNTGAFVTRIPLPGTPNALAIANGRAYVASGSGVFEVNYASFDASAEPPVVGITSLLPDADAGTPGVQIPLGSTIPFRTQVNSDAPVRNVTLLVNGEVAETDVSFPWEFSTIARDPALGALALAAASPITVQARATDTAGNVSLSNVLTFELVPDSVAPSVSGVVPADGSSATPGKRLVTVNFSEPMDPASAAAGDFVLQGPGGQFFVPQNIVFRNDERTASLTYAPLPAGSYTLTIGPDITDRVGNPLAASAMSDFDLIAATTTFTGAVDNQWIEPRNWSTGTVPGASDTVFVPAGNSVFYTGNTTITGLIGGGTIRGGFGELIVTGAGQIGRLVLSDPAFIGDTTLTVASTFTVTELFDWAGGTVRGAGTLVVPSSAALTFSASGGRVLNDATLDLEGAGTWTGGGSFQLQNTAVFNLEGSFTDSGDHTFSQSGSGNVFSNSGTFAKSGGTGVTAFSNLPFTNTGVVNAQNGTISFNNGGNSTGDFTAATGATVRFNGGTYQLDAGTAIVGAGRALLTAGTLNVAANVAAENFEMTGGTLTGPASLSATDSFTLTSGTLSGTGSADIAAGATFALVTASGASPTINGRTINNAGDATWTGNGGLIFSNGAVFNNTGSFTAQNNANFINGGGAASVFNNIGDFIKAVGTGTTQSNIPFTNPGTVTVESGTLGLPGGFMNQGEIIIRKIATLIVNGAFTNAAAATIRLDLGGTAAADFASMMVTGAATLNGTLSVFIVDSFTPGAGNTFQVLTYAGRTGSFATISDDDPAHVFNPAYNATNLTLTVA